MNIPFDVLLYCAAMIVGGAAIARGLVAAIRTAGWDQPPAEYSDELEDLETVS